jgi:hypothetical protein
MRWIITKNGSTLRFKQTARAWETWPASDQNATWFPSEKMARAMAQKMGWNEGTFDVIELPRGPNSVLK